ncbi:MAG: T9SS type A sorting domain-containing protein [Crocinitomicaceae bacterium]
MIKAGLNYRKYLSALLYVVLSFQLFGQFSEDSLIHFEVQGNDTDPLIILDGSKKHQVFYNPTSQNQGTLLLHMVGSIDNPNSTILYPSVAANNGFHCISLAYRNGVSGQSACGNIPDSDCHLNYRKEIIEGIDYSSEVNVNNANSIDNRLIKLLQYLDANYPSQNWSQYLSGNSVNWDKLIVSGHSQGGGHAAVIGITKPVQRVLMFGSPNDYSDTLLTLANWTQLPHLVADSNYYSFNALYDEVIEFWKQYAHSDALNLDNYGDTVNVDIVPSPFNASRQLYTKEIVTSPNPFELTHDVMIRDAETPLDGQGNPVFECAWKYMLGVECGLNYTEELGAFPFQLYPNPARDEIHVKSKNSLLGEVNICILDVLGRERMTDTISSDKSIINIQQLPQGVYTILLLQQGKPVGSERLIKYY